MFTALLLGIGTAHAMDLSGSWQFQLGVPADKTTFAPDPSPLVIPESFSDTIALPDTTNERHKGIKTTGSTKGTYTRRYSHIGRVGRPAGILQTVWPQPGSVP